MTGHVETFALGNASGLSIALLTLGMVWESWTLAFVGSVGMWAIFGMFTYAPWRE